MYDEADLLPISALQHLAFCRRQCALIHIEQAWSENRLTVEGRHLHERVHERDSETRGATRIARGLRLRSLTLGLSGVADVVEFHRATDGRETPFPVEYKRGKPKSTPCDAIQLCAQALCLEEMLGVTVPGGALFYGTSRRRLDVAFSADLREQTCSMARELHELIAEERTPTAEYGDKCKNCSLESLCMPRATTEHSVAEYLRRQVLAEVQA